MNWYLKVLKQYADFKGRARRKEYWMFVLFNAIISWTLQILAIVTKVEAFGYVAGIYSIAMLVPALAVAVRRLHDTGKSGWFYLIPIYNLILLCTNGEEGENQYGADPKNPTDELEEIGAVEA